MQKSITHKDLENILMQITIKNALLDKLGIKLDRAYFEAKLKNEIPESDANIGEYIKNLCDFGLISKNLSEKLIEKYSLNDAQFEAQNEEKKEAVSDFAGLEGDIQEYFAQNYDLKNLIENSDVIYDSTSLKEIYNLAKKLEAQAIEGYKKGIENAKKSEIKSPKSLINSHATGIFNPEIKINKKDIGKMTTDEFLKNEEIINKLMRQKML